MTPPDDKKLEHLIHQALHDLPPRRAPGSLELRVLAAIEQQARLPWWRQSFAHWPMPAQAAFIAVSIAVIAGILRLPPGGEAFDSFRSLAANLAWFDAVGVVSAALADSVRIVTRSIPPLWLYGGLTLVAGLYATLFGLGAVAYRALRPFRAGQ